MKLDEIKSQLGSKLRTTKDLLRFIGTRTDSNPNYTLLLGAGCSVSSGIRPATILCDIWLKEIISESQPSLLNSSIDEQREWLKNSKYDWYDSQREYSTLFERKYDLQRQRRMFVENEVKNAIPSIGYAYLTSLVEQNYFNTLFTTNFDDLINEAFFYYGKQRPIVCAHDSSINSVTVTSKRPKIIKLHGDYLFDDIKSTDRETESLGQNMKEKFIEFAKDFGMIVVGYAGGDRSIIDVLSLLLKNDDYFKNGLYWCIRKGSEIPEDLRRLFWKDRVYFVEIDGYDELFAEMFSQFNEGECLPLAAVEANDQHEVLIKKLLSQPSAFPETTAVLKSAKNRMLRQSKRKAIANLLVNTDEKDKPLSNSTYTDDELLMLTNLQRLQSDKKNNELIEKARFQLSLNNKAEVATQISNLLLNALVATRQEDEALRFLDKLERGEPRGTRWPLARARIVNSPEDKIRALTEACKKDDQSPEVHLAIARFHEAQHSESIGVSRSDSYENAINSYKCSLELDPSKRNSAWSGLHDLYHEGTFSTAKKNELLNEIETALVKQGDRHWRYLTLKTKRIDDNTDVPTVDRLIKSIDYAKSLVTKDGESFYERLKLKVLRQSNDFKRANIVLQSLIALNKHASDSALAAAIANCLRGMNGDDNTAKDILRDNLANDEFDADVFSKYFHTLIDLKELIEAEKLLDNYKAEIIQTYEYKLRRILLEAQGNYAEAILMIDKVIELGGKDNISIRSYLLLRDGQYQKAKNVCQNYLETVNFSQEASTETVNYELARKHLDLKPDNKRLDKLLTFDSSERKKAAVCALKDHKKDALNHIKNILRTDKTFRFEAESWPVFNSIRQDPLFTSLIKHEKN